MLSTTRALLFHVGKRYLTVSASVYEVLRGQASVTTCLKYAAHFESPRHLPSFGRKVIRDLHRVADEPVRKHRCTEPFARLRSLIRANLW